MENEKARIEACAEIYKTLVNAKSEEDRYKVLYTFPAYANSDTERAKYYRDQMQGHLETIQNACLEAEALIDEARYLLFKKEEKKKEEEK